WREGIKNKGFVTQQPAHINDIMPTCLELARATYPKKYNGEILDRLDGHSLLPLIDRNEQDKNREYYWEHEGNRALRVSNWKLVAINKTQWELYNLAVDPYELNNLIEQESEKASELLAKYGHM
ncbi:unnamed protein product, partial [marine sediment metagenome]